jgi:hypothetical protein
MVLGLLAVAIFLVMRAERKKLLALIISAIGLCLVIALLYDKVYIPRIASAGAVGYESLSALERMRYIRLIDFQRLNFGVFPSGILPFFSLLLYPWQDRLARTITLVIAGYFGIFFFQGYVALHHFVPVMILPLIVFWRLILSHRVPFRRGLYAATAVAGAVALFLALPRSFDLNHVIREIGQKMIIRIGDYETDHQAQVAHDTLFFKLFAPDWDVEDASQELITGYNSLIYYGSLPKLTGAPINYIVQSSQDLAPAGFTPIAQDDSAVIYVRDLDEWSRDRYRPLRTDTRSPLFTLPRSTLFNYFYWREHPQGVKIVDVELKLTNLLSRLRGLIQ